MSQIGQKNGRLTLDDFQVISEPRPLPNTVETLGQVHNPLPPGLVPTPGITQAPKITHETLDISNNGDKQQSVLKRSMIQPLKWAGIGFAAGLALWIGLNATRYVDNPSAEQIARHTPTHSDLAARDEAVSTLQTPVDEQTITSSIGIAASDIASADTKQRSGCTELEINRQENRTDKKPCSELTSNSWQATNTITVD